MNCKWIYLAYPRKNSKKELEKILDNIPDDEFMEKLKQSGIEVVENTDKK